MKLKCETFFEYLDEDIVTFKKENIIATETGHNDSGEWITIWYLEEEK